MGCRNSNCCTHHYRFSIVRCRHFVLAGHVLRWKIFARISEEWHDKSNDIKQSVPGRKSVVEMKRKILTVKESSLPNVISLKSVIVAAVAPLAAPLAPVRALRVPAPVCAPRVPRPASLFFQQRVHLPHQVHGLLGLSIEGPQ